MHWQYTIFELTHHNVMQRGHILLLFLAISANSETTRKQQKQQSRNLLLPGHNQVCTTLKVQFLYRKRHKKGGGDPEAIGNENICLTSDTLHCPCHSESPYVSPSPCHVYKWSAELYLPHCGYDTEHS